MAEQAKVTYAGVEIAYNEQSERWEFEIDGRERSAESLKNAKAAIEAPPPKERKPFVRRKVFLKSWNSNFQPVEITSVAEKARYNSGTYFWIIRDGKRSKEDANSLYEDTPENAAGMGEHVALAEQIEALQIQLGECLKKMTHPVDA